MGKLKKYCSLYLGFHKEFYKMKTIKIILVILLVAGLVFVGYKGFTYFKQWEANRFSEINTRCEERMKSENTRLSKGFTLKSILVAAIAGGFISLLCNYIPVLIK